MDTICCAQKILNQPAMDEFNGGVLSPGAAVDTDKRILYWVSRDSDTALHPSCACCVGTDNMSMADTLTLRVNGLDGLRLEDGSVMPYITNDDLYASVMMIAEKADDIIVGKEPLKAERAHFYRKAE